MRSHSIIGPIGRLFDVMGSAIAVTGAVRERRQPRDEDLNRLGIDPVQFRKIRY
ncbi:hypothetical protein [Chelativorans sp. Marseille-P2723]|uniref:hypothetical protein n=1 Tax=Chelativorans sp. Marseille-P2723 TaxID=2709133 RepID=UPI00156F7468|nr:hypothetical protein [Chelativorans sp. Marseille-P2723]